MNSAVCQGLLPTIRHFENRRGEGPGDDVEWGEIRERHVIVVGGHEKDTSLVIVVKINERDTRNRSGMK